MSLLSKLGIEINNDNETQIGLLSSRIAWFATSVVLLIWLLVDIIRTGIMPGIFILFAFTQAVYWFSYLYFHNRLAGK